LPLREKTQRVEATNKEMLGTSPEYRRITSKGQVTIPIAIRRRYSITMHTKLEFIPQPEGITIKPVREEGRSKDPDGLPAYCGDCVDLRLPMGSRLPLGEDAK